MWSPWGSESVLDDCAGRSIGLVWLENARANKRPRAFSAPPTSLVRSNFGAYWASLTGASTGASTVTSAVSSALSATGARKSGVFNTGVFNTGEFIGSVGSNNPGPLARFTGAETSREVRRGIGTILFGAVCSALRSGLVNGFTLPVDGLVLLAGGLAATNKRGDFSRRSSNVHPRGNVSRDACSSHRRFTWCCLSSSKVSSHTTQATRSIPKATSAGSLQPCFSQLFVTGSRVRNGAPRSGAFSGRCGPRSHDFYDVNVVLFRLS